MLTVALGIVLAVLILFALPFVVLAIKDWRWWRCWALGHRWYEVEPFTHSTGVLSMRKRHRCHRCAAIPTIADEQAIRRRRSGEVPA